MPPQRMKDNALYDKAADFADRILDMCDYLLEQMDGRKRVRYSVEVCVKQVTRSGTSIAANIAEGKGAQSKADLTSKLSIAIKEAFETECWLERLRNRKVLTTEEYNSINGDLGEILRLLVSSLNTLKNGKKD